MHQTYCYGPVVTVAARSASISVWARVAYVSGQESMMESHSADKSSHIEYSSAPRCSITHPIRVRLHDDVTSHDTDVYKDCRIKQSSYRIVWAWSLLQTALTLVDFDST